MQGRANEWLRLQLRDILVDTSILEVRSFVLRTLIDWFVARYYHLTGIGFPTLRS